MQNKTALQETANIGTQRRGIDYVIIAVLQPEIVVSVYDVNLKECTCRRNNNSRVMLMTQVIMSLRNPADRNL